MSEDGIIRFVAQISQVRTMADGGIRLTLDLPETAIEVAAAMMQARQAGAVLECAAVAVLQSITNGETKTRQRTTTSPIDMVSG